MSILNTVPQSVRKKDEGSKEGNKERQMGERQDGRKEGRGDSPGCCPIRERTCVGDITVQSRISHEVKESS